MISSCMLNKCNTFWYVLHLTEITLLPLTLSSTASLSKRMAPSLFLHHPGSALNSWTKTAQLYEFWPVSNTLGPLLIKKLMEPGRKLLDEQWLHLVRCNH